MNEESIDTRFRRPTTTRF